MPGLEDFLAAFPETEAPTEAEVGRVRRHAVADGGAVLQLPHRGRSTIFHEGQMKIPRRVNLTGCGNISQFTMPLDRQQWQAHISAKAQGVLGTNYGESPTPIQPEADGTKLCVVDDAAHLWPRFQR